MPENGREGSDPFKKRFALWRMRIIKLKTKSKRGSKRDSASGSNTFRKKTWPEIELRKNRLNVMDSSSVLFKPNYEKSNRLAKN